MFRVEGFAWDAPEFTDNGGPIGEQGGLVDMLVVRLDVQASGAEDLVPCLEVLVNVVGLHSRDREEATHCDRLAASSFDCGADCCQKLLFVFGAFSTVVGHKKVEGESEVKWSRVLRQTRCLLNAVLMPRGIFARKKRGKIPHVQLD